MTVQLSMLDALCPPQEPVPAPAPGYSVHLCPPAYPRRLRPFTCDHPVLYNMLASARVVPDGIEHNSPICLACGRPLPGATGGNVFSCITECLAGKAGWHKNIGGQLIYLRDRYLRVAAWFFDEDGWIGRHRKWAEVIDPHLTMRIFDRGRMADGTLLLGVCVDESYFASAGEDCA